MKKKCLGLSVFGLLACAAGYSQASLIDLGNGLVYDDVLGIHWLQNANLAATETFGVSGIDASGGMSWDTAKLWIQAMNSASYLGYSSWRLPDVSPLNGASFIYAASNDGSADRGYNITAPGTLYAGSPANEMSHLFHNSLGNLSYCAVAPGNPDADCISPTPDNYWSWGLVNTGPFTNLLPDRYWSNTEHTLEDWRAFDFGFGDGRTGTGHKGGYFHLIAVLDLKPTSEVPVPAAIWLLGSGLAGLVAASRRSRV